MSKKVFQAVILLAIFTCVSVLTGCSSNTGSKKEPAYPSKSVEFVVPFAPGGGSDVFARTVAKFVADKKLLSQPMIIVNKPGGSASVGYSYLSEKKGNPYYIGAVAGSFYTSPIAGKSPVSYKDFTFIAALAADPLVLMVNMDSKYKSLKELVEDAKANPGTVSAGGTSNLSDDAILFNMFADKTGAKMKYVPFNSGGEITTAILGGHITIAFLQPSEALAQMEAKKLRPLAVASKERLAGLDTPTFIENGIDVVFAQTRGIIGPKDMPAEAVQVLQEAFRKLSEDPDWKENYLKKNFISGMYLDSAAYSKDALKTHEVYLEYLTKMGAAKK